MSAHELKQRLTTFLFPSLLLIFVALYVTSLASGVAPELALLRSGGAGIILAVLGRVALGIINDEETLAINELTLLEETMVAEALSTGALSTAGEQAHPTAIDAPSDASAQIDAPSGFIPTPLVRGGQLEGQE